jgi:hypothetical protein
MYTESHEEERSKESVHGPNLEAEMPSVGGSDSSASVPTRIIDRFDVLPPLPQAQKTR